jgi:hypothetical protein
MDDSYFIPEVDEKLSFNAETQRTQRAEGALGWSTGRRRQDNDRREHGLLR